MFKEELKKRTKLLAIKIINFCGQLPNQQEFWIIEKQLIRSGTSVAANYRSACRARSQNEFVSKLSIVEEEADESIFWLELLEEITSGKFNLSDMKLEMNEILSIVISAKKTIKAKLEANS